VGVFPKEEKLEQEEFSGPQAPKSEEHNMSLEQGMPRCI
jgi:hypothetical protein